MKFKRIRNSQGLPDDYPLKPHHLAGYESEVLRWFKRGIRDKNGHRHGLINIEFVDGSIDTQVKQR